MKSGKHVYDGPSPQQIHRSLSYGLLPPELYQTGHFLYHRSQELMAKAWMVHVNFMPGGNSKIRSLKRMKLWCSSSSSSGAAKERGEARDGGGGRSARARKERPGERARVAIDGPLCTT